MCGDTCTKLQIVTSKLSHAIKRNFIVGLVHYSTQLSCAKRVSLLVFYEIWWQDFGFDVKSCHWILHFSVSLIVVGEVAKLYNCESRSNE